MKLSEFEKLLNSYERASSWGEDAVFLEDLKDDGITLPYSDVIKRHTRYNYSEDEVFDAEEVVYEVTLKRTYFFAMLKTLKVLYNPLYDPNLLALIDKFQQ